MFQSIRSGSTTYWTLELTQVTISMRIRLQAENEVLSRRPPRCAADGHRPGRKRPSTRLTGISQGKPGLEPASPHVGRNWVRIRVTVPIPGV